MDLILMELIPGEPETLLSTRGIRMITDGSGGLVRSMTTEQLVDLIRTGYVPPDAVEEAQPLLDALNWRIDRAKEECARAVESDASNLIRKLQLY